MQTQQTNNGVGVTIKGVKSVARFLKKASVTSEKALNTSLRVEGFRLSTLMQRQIRSGNPGGKPFAPLSHIAQRMPWKVKHQGGDYRWRSNRRKALSRLAQGVRYDVNPTPPFAVAVGFVGPQTWSDADLNLGYVGRRVNQYSAGLSKNTSLNPFGRGIGRSGITSKMWRWLAEQHQQGFVQNVTSRQRSFIVRSGAELIRKQSRVSRSEIAQTPFFLKKSTRQFKTPARPIIKPFWQAEKASTKNNIKLNFAAKMKGMRI